MVPFRSSGAGLFSDFLNDDNVITIPVIAANDSIVFELNDMRFIVIAFAFEFLECNL